MSAGPCGGGGGTGIVSRGGVGSVERLGREAAVIIEERNIRSGERGATGAAARSRGAMLAGLVGSALAAGTLSGCLNVDGWLWDPSVVGRWETTPTIVPVLDRIDVIEADSDAFVDVTPVEPRDLIPEPIDYRLNPGDVVRVDIVDFEAEGVPSQFELVVDSRGFISIRRLGRVRVGGLTSVEAQEAIANAVIEAQVLADPVVTVQVPGQRQATFGIYGAVAATGRYQIPFPDYRLLDAITDAGGISPSIPEIYIIRQVSLAEMDETGDRPLDFGSDRQRPRGNGANGDRPLMDEGEGRSIDDVLDDLMREGGGDSGDDVDPGVFQGNSVLRERLRELRSELDRGPAARRGNSRMVDADRDWSSELAPSAMQDSNTRGPVIDLPDSAGFDATAGTEREDEPAVAGTGGFSQWEFIDGRWVKVVGREPAQAGLPDGDDPLAAGDGDTQVVTQRIIGVPTRALLNGVARFNVVIRPGDLISVPTPPTGVYYMTGPGINTGGAFNISSVSEVTVLRALAASNGLSAIGIPERVDLTRRVGTDAQATIRINVKAIASGTAPDLVLKPDDLLNFGTNFWATPLAVVRNGFRASYGFGFLLDRNFGNDVFGAPPTNVGRN